MIVKSALKATIEEVAEAYEVDDRGFIEDLFDRLVQDFGEEIYDDEEEEGTEDNGPGFLGD